jgi:hypothetical protein
VETHRYTGLEIVPPANAGVVTGVTITPVWGGTGQTVTADMSLDIDHYRAMVP